MISTLNNMADLRNSEFGRPKPRHGLRLLYWFASDYIDFDHNNPLMVKHDPQNGDFGFHHFQNRRDNCDNNGCRPLLPEGFRYYEVGNLNKANSDSLPKYVRRYHNNTYQDNSNTDRIIISLRQNMQVEKVYVTQHEDMRRFDPTHTYCISKGLLKSIRSRPLDDFLNKAGYATMKDASPAYTSPACISPVYNPVRTESRHVVIDIPVIPVSQERKGICDRFCTIL